MAGDNRRSKRRAPDVKAPLVLSAVLGLVAFGITSLVGAGGTEGGLRLDLGLIIGGIAFIASVVVCATLMMIDKPNDPALGEGTGVNRSSAKLYAQKRATREQRQRRESQAAESGEDQAEASSRRPDDDGGPQYGQRVHPEQ